MHARATLGVITMLISVWAMAAPPPAKQIAAPPDDIRQGHLRSPDPAAAMVKSRSVMLPIRLTAGKPGNAVWEQQVPVESAARCPPVTRVSAGSAPLVPAAAPADPT